MQLTWLAVERDGVVVLPGSPRDDTFAAGPEAPSGGGSTASVGSPAQQSSEVALGAAEAVGAAGEPCYRPGVLAALPWGSAGVGSVTHRQDVRMRDPWERVGAFLEGRLLVAGALPLHESACLHAAASLPCFAWVAGHDMQVDVLDRPSSAGEHA